MCHNTDLSFFFFDRFEVSLPTKNSLILDRPIFYSDCKSIATIGEASFRWLTLSYDDRNGIGSAFNLKFNFHPFDFGASHLSYRFVVQNLSPTNHALLVCLPRPDPAQWSIGGITQL